MTLSEQAAIARKVKRAKVYTVAAELAKALGKRKLQRKYTQKGKTNV